MFTYIIKTKIREKSTAKADENFSPLRARQLRGDGKAITVIMKDLGYNKALRTDFKT